MLANQTLRAFLALILLALIWGYNWVVMKIALQDAGPFQLAAMRTFFGALVLFVLLYFSKRPMRLFVFPTMMVLGVFQNVGFTGFLMWALVSGGAGKTAVLTYTMPFWVMLLAWPVLGEKIRGWQWLAVTLMVVGMLLIFDPLHLKVDSFSMFLAVCSGISWALSAIISKQLHRDRPELDLLNLTAWPMLLGSLPMVVLAFIVPAPPPVWSNYLMGAVLFNVFLSGALAWLLWLYALQRIPAGSASMVTLLAPVVGVLAAWLQLNEQPTSLEFTGMMMIVFALLLMSIITIYRNQRLDVAQGQE